MNSPFTRYVLGPLTTLLALFLIHLASRAEWFTLSLALPVGVLALCLFWSGLRANAVSAALITAYALWRSDYDWVRTAQIIFTVWPVAILGGVMRRWLVESVAEAERQRLRAAENQSKADFVDTLNGNIQTIKEVNKELIELTNALPVLSRPEIQKKLNGIQGKAANLAQRVVGWHQLAEEKRNLLKDEP